VDLKDLVDPYSQFWKDWIKKYRKAKKLELIVGVHSLH
jgi:hypothetical protein